MSGNEFARLAYLLLLLVAVGGWVVAEARTNWGRSLRQALVWIFMITGLVAAFGLWGDIRDQIFPRQVALSESSVSVPRAADGHYRLKLELNGVPVTFIVDTGASDVVLTKKDAERVGIDTRNLRYAGRARTANGLINTAYANVQTITLGQITDRDLRVAINGGDMNTSLLGMRYLNLFSRIEIAGNAMILTR